jgi:hypothetical protein
VSKCQGDIDIFTWPDTFRAPASLMSMHSYSLTSCAHDTDSYTSPLLFALGGVVVSLVPLSSEAPDAKVAAANITRIQVVQVPPQTPKPVLARLDQQVHLASCFLLHPFDIPLHVEVGVAGANDGHLHVEELGKGLLPLVGACWVTETGVEAHDCVEVGVERSEVLSIVQCVEVFDVGADLHLTSEAVLDNGAEGVGWCARRERELCVTASHALRTNEDQVERNTREQV